MLAWKRGNMTGETYGKYNITGQKVPIDH